MTWRKIRAILQLRQESQNLAVPAHKSECFIIEKLNLQKISHTAEDYKSGKITYAEAEFDARVKIYQSVNPNFNPNVEYMKDPICRDVPLVDNSLFIMARKLILAKQRMDGATSKVHHPFFIILLI